MLLLEMQDSAMLLLETQDSVMTCRPALLMLVLNSSVE